ILGSLINIHWIKSKIVWFLIGVSGMYLMYDLLTYQSKGILNYEAHAQTAATVLMLGLILVNFLKQLTNNTQFNVTEQMLSMVFLAYFSINLIYTLLQNFIVNQSFANTSFVLFFSSYALLHIVYYLALA